MVTMQLRGTLTGSAAVLFVGENARLQLRRFQYQGHLRAYSLQSGCGFAEHQGRKGPHRCFQTHHSNHAAQGESKPFLHCPG